MNKCLKLIGISFLFLGLVTPTVHASEETGGYSIEGIPKQNQLDPDVGYFYLHEEVGSEDSVKVKLSNTSDQDKTLKIDIADANTNVNGLIDYTGKNPNDSSLKIPLTSIATPTQKEVKVPKQGSTETEIKIKMPNTSLQGVVVGGINVSEKQAETKNKNNLSLSNTYSYTLGLVVTNENKVEINKCVSVELKSVGAKLFDGRKVVQADILNPNPYIFAGAKVKGQILEKDSQKIVKEQENKNINIAPYSVYPFQFDWLKEELKPGKYVFKGTVEASEKTWKFEKEFEISSEKAKTINKESVFKVYIPNWLTYSSYGLGVLSTLGTIYLIFRRKNRKMV